MMKNITYILKKSLCIVSGGILLSSCTKNLPDERLSIAANSQYISYEYRPILGRNTLFTDNFQYGNSSRPLNFKIVNMRGFNGEAATELTDKYPVLVWKTAYNGTEKSIAEIDAKRVLENHSLFEVRPHSGEFIMWAAANSNVVKAQPDSGYVFDVEMSNSGGRKYFQNFRLRPLRERPFEPSNWDPVTGQGTNESVSVTSVNMDGERGQPIFTSDVQVSFREVSSLGNSLTFKFVDSLSNPINPDNFDKTDWNNLVHGFNMTKDATKVKYDVAYPVPCSNYPTKYTTLSGSQASVVFRFDRIAFGNVLRECTLGLNFNIYKKGDWEITFAFKRDKPKFDND